jgi:transcriptional regulator with XRE-family HTH domain
MLVDETKFYHVVGSFIKEKRESRGLSRQQLADLIDVSRPNVVHFETRYIRISLFKLVKVAKALEVSVTDLLPTKYKQ